MSYQPQNVSAPRRVLSAPGLVLTLVLVQLALGLLVSHRMQAGAGAALGRHAVLDDGQLLPDIAELMGANAGLRGVVPPLLSGSVFLGAVFWTLVAGGLIFRLHRPAPASAVAGAAVRHLPGIVVTTLWHLLPRLVLLGLLAFAVRKLEGGFRGAAICVLAAALFYCTCALDLARCQVVLHGARRWHPRTAWRGYVQALRRPRVLLPSMLLSLGQWAVAFAVLATAISGVAEPSTVWIVRGLAVVGLLLGLTRLAVAVGAGPPGAR